MTGSECEQNRPGTRTTFASSFSIPMRHAWVLWLGLILIGCGDRGDKAKGGTTASCNENAAYERSQWVLTPSPNWSGDPDNFESLQDSGLRVTGHCNTALKYRGFSCDRSAHEANVYGFIFFIAEKRGFATVICDEIDGIDGTKRLVEYPIVSSYRTGEFSEFMDEGFSTYAEYACKCRSRSCAEKAAFAFNQLDTLTPLLGEDASQERLQSIDKSRRRYAKCEARLVGQRSTPLPDRPRQAPPTASPSKPGAGAKAAPERHASGGQAPRSVDPLASSTEGKPGVIDPSDTKRNLPLECTKYKAAIGRLSRCTKLPETTRALLQKSFNQTSAAWSAVPPEGRQALATSCAAAADAVSQSMTACDQEAVIGNDGSQTTSSE